MKKRQTASRFLSAGELLRRVAHSFQKASAEARERASYEDKKRNRPLMPTWEERLEAEEILRNIPDKVAAHKRHQWPGDEVKIFEVECPVQRSYAGPWVNPPRPCAYAHMRGVLRAVYKMCRDAGLKPYAHWVDKSSGSEIWLHVTVTPQL